MSQASGNKKETLNKKLQLASEHLKALAAENENLTHSLEVYTNKEIIWEDEKLELKKENQDLHEKNSVLQGEIDRLKTELALKIGELEEMKDVGSKSSHTPENESVELDKDIKMSNKSRRQTTLATSKGKSVGLAITKPDHKMEMSWEEFVQKLANVLNIKARKFKVGKNFCNEWQLLDLIMERETERQKSPIISRTKSNENDLESKKNVKEMEIKITNLNNSYKEKESMFKNFIEALKNIKEINVEEHGFEKREMDILLSIQNDLKKQKEQEVNTDQQINEEESSKKLEQALEEKRLLEVEYEMLLEKVGRMQDALKAKMKAESKELDRLRKQLATSNENEEKIKHKVLNLESLNMNLEENVKKSQLELIQAQETIAEIHYQAEYEQQLATDNINSLEISISNLKDEINAIKSDLESSIIAKNELENRNLQLQRDIGKLLNSQELWVEEQSIQNTTIQNLQNALELLQRGNESEMHDLLNQLNEERKKFEMEKQDLNIKMSKLEVEISESTTNVNLDDYDQLKHQLGEQATTIAQLRKQVFVLNEHLTESMRRIKDENDEYTLDRRVISSLFVSFFAMPYGDSKRYEVLQLISNILQLNEQQRQKIGLIRKAGRPTNADSDSGNSQENKFDQSMSDMWISYLLRESSQKK
ncbi:hypothetical protein BB559_003081 [Furculomyces boomerangus]|uniref:GRIP domain-containing protein n=3 Tax=Harpellales TaxID=61421 RepID=A0A2T9YP44_9FUNG|nr:hypothetical protein BB559_003081 [Furculomyces boomerangus]PVZ96662.1 hypothetical protein BB558_007416 [Smittium angustum]